MTATANTMIFPYVYFFNVKRHVHEPMTHEPHSILFLLIEKMRSVPIEKPIKLNFQNIFKILVYILLTF